MNKLLFGVAALAAAVISTPAVTQGYPFVAGDYWDVSAIEVSDGGGLSYANHLANNWRKNQEYAKSQGWIKNYYVLGNEYPRKGEPDLYLITVFDKMVDAAEGERRREAFEAFNKRTTAQLQAESGDRAKFRTLAGDMLLRELKFK